MAVTDGRVTYPVEVLDQETAKQIISRLKQSRISYLHLSFYKLLENGLDELLKLIGETEVTNFIFTHNVAELGSNIIDTLSKHLSSTKITDFTLIFENDTLNNDMFLSFSQIKNSKIKKFNFCRSRNTCTTQVSSEGMRSLAMFINDSNMSHLNISGCKMSDENFYEFFNSLENKKLKYLDISCNSISTKGVEALSEYLKGSDVEKLNMYINKITDVNIFVNSLPNTNVTHLDISANQFEIDGILTIIENLNRTKIVMLNIKDNYDCAISSAEVSRLVETLKCCSLNKLVYNFNWSDLESVKYVFRSLAQTQLESLTLMDDNMPPNGSLCLTDFLNTHQLSHLCLDSVLWSSAEIYIFIQSLKSTKLTRFEFRYVNISENNLRLFGDYLKNSNITRLELCRSGITNNVTRTLFASIESSKITHLSLDSNVLGEGLADLAKILPNTHITNLNLRNIGGEVKLINNACKTFSNCLKNTKIAVLRFDFNDMSNANEKEFYRGIRNSQITRLIINVPNKKKLEFLIEHMRDCQLTHVVFNLDINETLEDYDGPNLGCSRYYIDYISHDLYYPLTEVLFDNHSRAKNLIDVFKSVLTYKTTSNLEFSTELEQFILEDYIDRFIWFMKTIRDIPGIISHIIHDQAKICSRETIMDFIKNIAHQFSLFVATQFEIDNADQVRILKKIEQERFSDIVESLLLHRPIYFLDECLHIFHPYVYVLLHKYDLPLYYPDLEPDKKEVIIKYFMENIHLENATDVVEILKQIKK